VNVQPAPAGRLSVLKTPAEVWRGLVQDDLHGHYRQSRESLLLKHKSYDPPIQQRLLAWLRDHVNQEIPRAYYRALLGHDLHVSTYAELYVTHFHATERDPFTGRMGWLENVGLVSRGKVTTAFRDFETAQLVTETSTYGDYKWHEVGTSATAEANSQTALVATTSIARVAGTQVDVGSGVYRSVGTVTADTSETWQEHGIFNIVTAGTMMDRSLISPTVAVVASDTVTFTYELTKSAES
jgi:hypothetical protein